MNREQLFREIVEKIWKKTVFDEFLGSDPYDGLNSIILGPLLMHSRKLRFVITQLVKRCPVNLRQLLMVPIGSNPKGLALFLSGLSDVPSLNTMKRHSAWLTDLLLSQASSPDGSPALAVDRRLNLGLEDRLRKEGFTGEAAMGWGYNFPWQGRAFYQPAWSPTVVCTSFVLDAFSDSKHPLLPAIATSSARFVGECLNRHEDSSGVCFSYSPFDNTRVFNASLFGAKILARANLFSSNRNEVWKTLAEQAVAYVIAKQKNNGSWAYGEAGYWQRVDNLHTGFVIETIEAISQLLQTTEWDNSIRRGLEFYSSELFESDGTAKYYSDSKYPLDPHSFAQGAITFLKLSRHDPDAVETAGKILSRGINLLWNERKKGFIFQRYRYYTNPVVHLRWSQAWMFRAIGRFLSAGGDQ